MIGYTFGGKDRLKGKKLMDRLFADGKSVTAFPLRMVYLETTFRDGSKIKTGVSVGKRNFKSAVDRNRIKRLLREAYRLNKKDNFNNISASYALMILYLGKDGTDFASVNQNMKKLLKKFSLKISDA